MTTTVLSGRCEQLADELNPPDYNKLIREATTQDELYGVLSLVFNKKPPNWADMYMELVKRITAKCSTRQEFNELIHAVSGFDAIEKWVRSERDFLF